MSDVLVIEACIVHIKRQYDSHSTSRAENGLVLDLQSDAMICSDLDWIRRPSVSDTAEKAQDQDRKPRSGLFVMYDSP